MRELLDWLEMKAALRDGAALVEAASSGIKSEKIQKLKSGKHWDLWAEKWTTDDEKDTKPIAIHVYRNKAGDMIDAKHNGKAPGLIKLINKLGIEPKKRCKSHSCCSVGKGADGKWYGWSHRAICGFGPGDMMFNPNVGGEDEPYNKRGNVQIQNDIQAKIAAERFAADVS